MPPDAYNILVTFNSFNTQEEFDYFELYDFGNGQQLGLFSGDTLPESILCPSGKLRLLFKTDQTITADGWEIEYITNVVNTEELDWNTLIRIYPNPTSKNINIEFNTPEEQQINASMISITGQTIHTEKWILQVGNNVEKINAEELTKGIYFLRLQTEDSVVVRKVVVE